MKKLNKNPKSLLLSVEKIRDLSNDALEGVVGGAACTGCTITDFPPTVFGRR